MSTKHPVENLLRPAYETMSAMAYGLAGTLTLVSPAVLMGALSTPSLTYGIAAGLFARCGQRFLQARKLLKYQYEMHVLPGFTIDSNDIPISKENLYLGLGFEWTARHTQRRVDFDRQEFDWHRYRHQTWQYKAARTLEKVLRRSAITAWMAWASSTQAWYNPVAPIPYVEGNPEIHAVGLWEGEVPIYERQAERVAHTFVVGTTRVGKTRLAEVLITQDIHNNEIVIIFDPKGDPDLLKRTYIEAVKAGRAHQFYCFHLGYPEISARYNPVGSFSRITEPASRIAGQLPGEGNSAAFREFAWRYVNVISKAITALGKPISYETLLAYGSDIDPLLLEYLSFVFAQPQSESALHRAGCGDWNKAIKAIAESDRKPSDKAQASRDRKTWAAVEIYKEAKIVDPVAHALIKTFEYEKTFYDKLVASLFPLLEKLTSGPTAELLSPNYDDLNDPRPIFDWSEIIRTGGIVYCGFDALTDAEVAQAVSSSMFADLTSTAGSIYKFGQTQGLSAELASLQTKRKICIHADEFNELVGKEFVPMANKAGGAGFQLTVYTQTLSDIKARFGDDAKAGQVIGNLGNLIMLRVKEHATAELLTKLLPNVEVNHLTLVSGTSDDTNPDSPNDFTSNTQQRISTKEIPLVATGDLTRLPKGHAYAMLGGKLYKLRIPQFKATGELPDDLDFLYTKMRETYDNGSANDEWFNVADIKVAA
ncbi:conjugative coupling factor TraD, PFGI-1 class [Cellvibrio sp. KY-GH-1]|nr:conjugative coupling factor TraD, PFGI-1 class [Cellvibrio sp. KY-GH-1]